MRDFSFCFLFRFLFEKAIFGRSLAQLIFAALSLYPFGVKENQKRRFFSDVPFGRFCLAVYPSADFAASGESWPLWAVVGWTFACWDLQGWNMAFWIGFGASQAGILPSVAPLALKFELMWFPGALCVLLYGGGLSAYQPLYPFRPSSHKYGFFSRAP